jgi:hypothetical protein
MTEPLQSPGRHQSLYQALLALYPPSFRHDYGDAMQQLFGDRLRELGARAWLETVPDLVRTVPHQRREAVMASLGPGARVGMLTALVVGALVASIGFGGGAVPLLLVVAVVLIVARSRAVASAPFGERAPLWPAVVQAWWAPLAALLGAATIILGIGTIFEAHNLGGRIFGSGVLLLLGSTMLLGLMRRPFDRMAGNSMILVATVPGLAFFWVIVPAVVALVVWVGVFSAGFSDEPTAATTG